MTTSAATSNKRILDLAIKDLRQITRDRKSFIFLLIMPIAFTLLFGFAFGGNSTADSRLPIGLADEDGSELSARLAAMLGASEVVRIENEGGAAGLSQQVADEAISAAVIIPPGYGDSSLAGNPMAVMVVGGGQAGFTVDGEVQKYTARLQNAVQAANLSLATAVDQELVLTADQQAYWEDSFAAALAAWDSPPVIIRQDESSALSEEAQDTDTNYSVFAVTSPGMMSQFAIAGLMGAAGILVVEKKTKSLQRLLTTNMSMGQILAGHFLAMFILIFIQLSVLILFGQIFLDLPYLGQPLATFLLTVMTALFTAGLGMLIGVAAKSEEQVVVLSLVPMFLLAALGGAWVPMEFTPQSFQRIALLTPLAWVMEGYKDILIRGQGMEAISLNLLVLLLYTAVLLGLAVWRFRVN
ncbi:MAG: ABC transporter permease [Candidatus Promineifilaceae bacterium]|jgi:ABC-2 type transport system permease protein